MQNRFRQIATRDRFISVRSFVVYISIYDWTSTTCGKTLLCCMFTFFSLFISFNFDFVDGKIYFRAHWSDAVAFFFILCFSFLHWSWDCMLNIDRVHKIHCVHIMWASECVYDRVGADWVWYLHAVWVHCAEQFKECKEVKTNSHFFDGNTKDMHTF